MPFALYSIAQVCDATLMPGEQKAG